MTERTPQENTDVKVALHEQRLGNLEQEQTRARERLHNLEQDRIALKLMAAQIESLAKTSEVTAGTLSTVDNKLTALLITQAREEGEEATRRDWLSSRRFVVASLIGAATAIVALASVLLTILIHS